MSICWHTVSGGGQRRMQPCAGPAAGMRRSRCPFHAVARDELAGRHRRQTRTARCYFNLFPEEDDVRHFLVRARAGGACGIHSTRSGGLRTLSGPGVLNSAFSLFGGGEARRQATHISPASSATVGWSLLSQNRFYTDPSDSDLVVTQEEAGTVAAVETSFRWE